MNKRLKILTYLLLIPSFSLRISANELQFKYDNNAEKKFFIAVEAYKIKEFQKAAELFENLIGNTVHQRTTASYIMLGKTYLQLGKNKNAISTLKKFITLYPESNYIDDAYYTAGMVFFHEKLYETAVESFLNVLEVNTATRTAQQATEYLEKIIVDNISEKSIIAIINKQKNKDSRILLKCLLANKQFKTGEYYKAKTSMDALMGEAINSKHYTCVNKLAEMLRTKTEITIGLLLPLMKSQPNSPIREIGEELLKGIQFGVDEFNSKENNVRHIVLEIIDTERSIDKAQVAAQSIARKENLLAVIGPVFSNEVQAIVKLAEEYRIPFITPTATANQLTVGNEYLFQANPDLKTRGKAIAIYAVKVLGLINLAVVMPNEPSCKSVAESFAAEAQRLGANVIALESYEKGSSDLSTQFRNLRKIGITSFIEPVISFDAKFTNLDKVKILKAGANAKLVDSVLKTNGSIGVNRLFGKRGRHIADSLGIKYKIPSIVIDNLDEPVNSIHGIFFPILSSDEIGVITSYLDYYNINTQVLGTSEWYDERKLNQHAEGANGSIFFAESYLDWSIKPVAEFLKKYQKQVGGLPSNNFLFGYDAVSLVLREIKKNVTTRENLKIALSRVKRFQGIHSKISLKNERVNSEIHILQYYNGKVNKIGEIDVSDK